ncbi:hypothetical protein F2Q69_00055557 [Brassica cretica]|uniref:Uncharacterized protein n=1 Tax=Brassica cretica TaxID=69181 RepID=A0A8S9N1C0_BRACR|nr:hypothetical protein F2Q69_00055557 [Brassica cretica]
MRSSKYSDEFPRNIPMKYRGNHIPRKTPTNIRGYIIAVREPLGDFKNSEEIPRKEPLPSGFRRNFFGTSVPKKKGRLVGLGRRARSVLPSAPQPYVDPEGPMDQLKDNDDRIAALEQMMADQEAGWEATRKQKEQMMEMMKRMYPNEQFP